MDDAADIEAPIDPMAQVLAIEISPESRPALLADLAAAFRMASLVMGFPLDDHPVQRLPARAAGPRRGIPALFLSRLVGVSGGGVIKVSEGSGDPLPPRVAPTWSDRVEQTFGGNHRHRSSRGEGACCVVGFDDRWQACAAGGKENI